MPTISPPAPGALSYQHPRHKYPFCDLLAWPVYVRTSPSPSGIRAFEVNVQGSARINQTTRRSS
jgi:hypothetical protein